MNWKKRFWCLECYHSIDVSRPRGMDLDVTCQECDEDMVGYNPKKYTKIDGELVRRSKVSIEGEEMDEEEEEGDQKSKIKETVSEVLRSTRGPVK